MMNTDNIENAVVNEKRDGAEISFEEALARLEEIVRALESGNAQLDKSLSMFEEGVKLVRLCNDKLDGAEQRIKILFGKENGEYGEQDFGKTE